MLLLALATATNIGFQQGRGGPERCLLRRTTNFQRDYIVDEEQTGSTVMVDVQCDMVLHKICHLWHRTNTAAEPCHILRPHTSARVEDCTWHDTKEVHYREL